MRALLFALTLLLLGACVSEPPPPSAPPNRWSGPRMLLVLEAQEHRDTQALCALLMDSSFAVREAAALAFASVQDSASIPCLLVALKDHDARVRSTAAFALGFIADSSAIVDMAELAILEQDTTVQRSLLSASFLAMQRNDMLKDPNAILYFLDRNKGQDRVRAADALRRLPDSTIRAIAAEYLALFENEPDNEVEAMLVRGLARVGTSDALSLLRFSADADKPEVIIPNAIRTLGQLDDPVYDSLLFHWVGPGCIGQAALEALQHREHLDPANCLSEAELTSDPMIRIALLGLVIRHGGEGPSALEASKQLAAWELAPASPYIAAALITAGSEMAAHFWSTEDRSTQLMDTTIPSVQRQGTFQSMVKAERQAMMRSRYATREAQYAGLHNLVSTAIATQDAGLICAVAELLVEEEPEVIGLLLPRGTEQVAMEPLHPIRDLEAFRLVSNALARRDALPPPMHGPPSFNHPIDTIKLRELPQGQRYRISTAKGEIIIATDVNECPGSSLAFDSLVTAGYYNGKAFHRMVPSFVVQGGCPRGDGYGGMPWTLRTEIGRKLFTAGSVGLASAGRDTESCQFFITHSAAPHLDGRYTRFGEVVSGMDVVWQLQVGDVMSKVERANR